MTHPRARARGPPHHVTSAVILSTRNSHLTEQQEGNTMSEFHIKLAGALPKGDTNGWADPVLAEDLARAVTEGRSVQPRVAVIVYDAKSATVGTDGEVVVTVRVRRVQPVTSLTNRRSLEQILLSEYREQTGASMLPFDVEAVTKQAFRDLPKSNDEIDQEEAEEQDRMSPTDELRRHLERVHGTPEAHLLTAEDAESKHTADHDGGLEEKEILEHPVDEFPWTRADLEVLIAAAGDSGTEAHDEDEDESSDPDQIPGVAFSGTPA